MQPDPFRYVTPTPEMVPHFNAIAMSCADLYVDLMKHVPESAERTLAIRKLQEVRMWANAAISGVHAETRGTTYSDPPSGSDATGGSTTGPT